MNNIFNNNTNQEDYTSVYNPVSPKVCFRTRDFRVLSDRSIFEQYDALRKTYQFEKDFFTDQDSVAGTSIIPNMIKNILCTKLGSLEADKEFGIDLSPYLFEQLDWVGVIAIRDAIANALNINLPASVTIDSVDIKANTDKQQNSIDVDIVYSYYSDTEYFEENSSVGPGPNLNTRRTQFTVGVDGFTNFSQPGHTQFRRSVGLINEE